jgi:exopolysaccharide biosynthesis polyprenyl glycosylphosphotransferase
MLGVGSHIQAKTGWLAVMDLGCLVVASVFGIVVRLGPGELGAYVSWNLNGWILLFAGVLLANYVAGSYSIQHTFSRFNLVVTWVFSMTFVLLVLSVISYAWFIMVLGRGVLALTLGAYSALSLFLKLAVYRALFRREAFICRTVILDGGPRARELRGVLENKHVLPVHKVVAFVEIEETEPRPDPGKAGSWPETAEGAAMVTCTPDELGDVIQSLRANLIVVGLEDMTTTTTLYRQLKRLRFEGIEVLTPLNVAEIYAGRLPLDQVSEDLLMRASMESGLPSIRRAKRVFDVLASGLALVVYAPFIGVISALIKMTDRKGKVFYQQVRTGQFGQVFRMYKFRTMREGAEEGTGAVWASNGDPRITGIGRFLRRFRLDEIPQFINVLRGEMSLVGPRPERPELEAELEAKVPFFSERHNVMPGLTGWAQIRHPYGDSVEDAARKLEYDLYYIKNQSLSLDLQIILSTLRIVILGKERQN